MTRLQFRPGGTDNTFNSSTENGECVKGWGVDIAVMKETGPEERLQESEGPVRWDRPEPSCGSRNVSTGFSRKRWEKVPPEECGLGLQRCTKCHDKKFYVQCLYSKVCLSAIGFSYTKSL